MHTPWTYKLTTKSNHFLCKLLIEGPLKTAFRHLLYITTTTEKTWNFIKIMFFLGAGRAFSACRHSLWSAPALSFSLPGSASVCLSRQLPSQQLPRCNSGKALFHIQTAGNAQIYSASASANLFTFHSGFKDICNSTRDLYCLGNINSPKTRFLCYYSEASKEVEGIIL